MWYTIGFLLLIAGSAVFFLSLFPRPSEFISVFGERIKESESAFSFFLSPFAPLNEGLIRILKIEKPLKNKMYLAKWKTTPGEFMAGKELLAIALPLILFLLGVKQMLWLSIAAVIGLMFPDIILNSRVKKRKYSIVRILPETIDLLGLCVGAGLDFMAAVRWVVDKVKPNPMIEELVLVLKEINVGKPRVEALRDMAKRLDIPDVTSFVRTLIQADRMGTPVEEAFRILSEDSRMRRFHRGERQAMKAPLKMLIPLIFCILPVILIIVAGPILIRFIKEGLFAGM
ncbi:MAG: type II secretion system F family protein [Candidatus Omnitrophica bacterium]|jgi:tight adherence protein C|nr:type II secretion system F family protein [Candidatus Omnitrophota bacterium]